jgi:hypothetical protein
MRRRDGVTAVRGRLWAIVPIMSFGRDRLSTRAQSHRCRAHNARAMSGRKPRQRRDIEMIVVRVRNQDDIDRRQVRKGDA